MAAERITAKNNLAANALAEIVGMKEDYACMNRVCSKLVHPAAWSVLAVNKGENSFPQCREILLQCGASYGCDMYLAVKEHAEAHGMKPKA